jgi:hypothetical protein
MTGTQEYTLGGPATGVSTPLNQHLCHSGTFCQMGTDIDRAYGGVSTWDAEHILVKPLFNNTFNESSARIGISWHFHCVLNTWIRVKLRGDFAHLAFPGLES